MRITIAAPAKVNLWLRVGPPEPSGFHGIDTLFCALQLADTVVLRSGQGPPTLQVGHARPLRETPDLGQDEDNLAVRAARSFMERAGLTGGPDIRLVKRVPVGAGLGGGSSDAAAVLRGMARLHPGALPDSTLMELAAELGSDVPFFLQGAPLALGSGRGERLTVVRPLAQRHVVVAIPAFSVATGAAYGWLDQDRSEPSRLSGTSSEELEQLDWAAVGERALNDFEGPVFRRHPELEVIRDGLRDRGARPALLAGSGSTVFGVFEDRGSAREAAIALEDTVPGLRTVVTRTRPR